MITIIVVLIVEVFIYVKAVSQFNYILTIALSN